MTREWIEIQRAQKKLADHPDHQTVASRRIRLAALRRMITEHEAQWIDALADDLGKSAIDAYVSEIGPLLAEIDHLSRHISRWTRPKRAVTGWLLPMSVKTVRQPYGSVLVISPWNYPVLLALVPLAGALAAGNCCFIKPSELAPASSRLLAKLIAESFRREDVMVVEGDGQAASDLLSLSWDFIFFTGSQRIGRVVSEAAAHFMTPLILELGGRNPCVILDDRPDRDMIRQIVWGKFFNCGQTCVAPDFLLVPARTAETILSSLVETVIEMYGSDPRHRADYGHIISERHWRRLTLLLEDGQLIHGGESDRQSRYLSPTILTHVPENSQLLQEEIFGPVMPVLTYNNLDELRPYLAGRPSPLTTYLFGRDRRQIRSLLPEIRSGSIMINQVMRQAASPKIPFGGVGESGSGRYHGKASFDAMTWQQPIISSGPLPSPGLRYPPYDKRLYRWIRRFRRWLY